MQQEWPGWQVTAVRDFRVLNGVVLENGPKQIRLMSQTVEFVSRNAAPCNWRNIGVVGHADRSGSNEYNVGLSQRRAQAVADLLVSMGVPRTSIQITARGEEQPRVPTADGVREPQNRRVEMTVR